MKILEVSGYNNNFADCQLPFVAERLKMNIREKVL